VIWLAVRFMRAARCGLHISLSVMKLRFLSILALCFSLLPLAAAEGDLAKCTIGTLISGEEVSLDDLDGKVVVIEHWGVRCPPCIAAIPHLVKLDRRYSTKGLVIIADESQNSAKEDILKLVKSNRIKYTITQGTRNPSAKMGGIPHAVVFGVDGNVVFQGHPSHDDFDKAIKKALREVKK